MPLALSVDGIASFVVGKDDLYVLRDGLLTKQNQPELSRAAVTALAADGDALFGLRTGAEGSSVVRIDRAGEGALFESSEIWWALAIEAGRLHLGRPADAGEIAVTTLDRGGHEQSAFRIAVYRNVSQLRLEAIAGRLFAVVYDGEHYELGEADAGGYRPLVLSPGPIDGPIASDDGTLWIAVDGELMRETASGFEAAGEPRRVTCLSAWRDWVHACVDTELYRLTDEGLSERLFGLEALAAPDPALVPDDASFECDVQWQLFQSDLRRIGLTPRERPPTAGSGGTPDAAPAVTDAGAALPEAGAAEPRGGASGCSIGAARGAAAGSAWLAIAFGLGCARRSRRARRAPLASRVGPREAP